MEIDDHLYYNEPWVWMQPPRHALGALLLEQGHVEDALQVYRSDLGLDDTLVRSSQHPGNVWALHGYAECLDALGRPAGPLAALLGRRAGRERGLQHGRGDARDRRGRAEAGGLVRTHNTVNTLKAHS